MADATVSKTVGGNSMWVRLPPSAPSNSIVGAWLSLVERSVRDAEVGGSNPLAPTTEQMRGVMTCVITPLVLYPDGILLQREVRQSVAGAGWLLGGRPG